MNGRSDGAARFSLRLAPRQARLVAEALGLRPYAQVQALMARLEEWARAWRAEDDAGLVLDAGELALVVSALSDLPYRRVHVLVRGLEAQLAALRAQAGRPALEPLA
ncbi:hypothetical protein [Massilia timonae]|uniref:Uncharacterized protein n=1 Tax=Massilia timonae TaxID=47229 RepID=A0A1S2N7J2_9BURK|nr:hypothetical protein [Massilia timonae]OIJ41019.1 hypothetical protein LO55_3780 [Massilia timonae]